MSKEETFYNIGKRDECAWVLMRVREEKGNIKKVVLEIADMMLRHDKEHTHALWVKNNIII